MSEQRIEDYLNLILELLNCAEGQEFDILHSHSWLLDEDLLHVMDVVATDMREAGEANAEWLGDFSARLAAAITSYNQLNQQVIQLYRIPKNDPWKYDGTGLGLALVGKLTQHLGAAIDVESGAGKTTFTLSFPL